jgi:hypothetical protein
MFDNFLFFENRAVYERMWNNKAKPIRPQITIWRMRIACWITKATKTHSQYVIPIAFPLKQRLHERASMLRYTYSACLVLGENQLSSSSMFQHVHITCNLCRRLSHLLPFYGRGKLSYLVITKPPYKFIL